LREARRQLKKQYEDEDAKFKGGLQKLEAIMLAHLNAANADSVRTENGTFYKQEAITPSASDWQLVYDWIKDNDAWDLLERRVKSTFIKEYQEAHDGALPPGISVYREVCNQSEEGDVMAQDVMMLGGAGNVPAHLQQAFTETNIEDRASVPSLMVTGKIWTISYEGTKTPLQRSVDGDIIPVSIMRGVVLDYAKRRGRAYYEGAYDPNSTSAPVCWSDDGVVPEPTSPKLQSDKCATCPRAIKGSKVTEQGKETVECAQHRMLAIQPVIGDKFFPHPLRLKLAITSDWDKDAKQAEAEGWRAWQQYTDFLKANGVTHTAMLVTKMKFDTNAAYPKVFFAADRWLTADELAKVKPLTTDPDTTKLLGGTWTPAGADGVRKDETTATTAAPATKAQASTASVEDEDAGEIVMAGLDVAPVTPVQEPAQAKTPKATPPKPEPVAAAAEAAEVAPKVSSAVPDDVAALLAGWTPDAAAE
jgi:hypothetical protein